MNTFIREMENHGIDISIAYRTTKEAASAWYVEPIKIEPVRGEGFVGSVAEGGSVNFRDITFNPHGNGTHTECVGHIAPECFSVNQHLKQWMFKALVITLEPKQVGEDLVLTLEQFQTAIGNDRPEALVLRTLPNDDSKVNRQYSNSNPAYMDAAAAHWLRVIGVEHLLLDLPSVDREVDGGELAAHKAFWNYPESPRMEATITAFIYVPSEVNDGEYLLNLQVAPFENDAAPSRPVLYRTAEFS
ncbi:MAG: cyclase family protein [Flavobacteriales bacterium]|nr:cyclase family protein [Flavobacteriales bacterium]